MSWRCVFINHLEAVSFTDALFGNVLGTNSVAIRMSVNYEI